MTDQQSYDMIDGTPILTIERTDTTPTVLLIRLPNVSDHDSVAIASRRLLAMIDTIDPDAMRGYLRERSDYLDSPDESCSPLEDMLPADLAAKAARFREVPEADSPEDVDEQPEPGEVERRLHVIERLASILRAGTDAVEVCTLADWVIDR